MFCNKITKLFGILLITNGDPFCNDFGRIAYDRTEQKIFRHCPDFPLLKNTPPFRSLPTLRADFFGYI